MNATLMEGFKPLGGSDTKAQSFPDPDTKSQSFPLLPLIAHKYEEGLPVVFFKELLSSTIFSSLIDFSNTGSTSLFAAVISIDSFI